MKLFSSCSLFAILAVLSWSKADLVEDMTAISKICQQEVKTTTEELDKFFKSGMNSADVNDAIKCHIKCVMEKQGHFKNGIFDEQAFVKDIPNMPGLKNHPAEFTKVAAECKDIKGANDCDTAFKILMCFKDKKTELGIAR